MTASLRNADAAVDLRAYEDCGVWISDDRVSAFVSAACCGIAEAAYHGSQPVSRNSRIFSAQDGVFIVEYALDDAWHRFDFSSTRADADCVVADGGGAAELRITARASMITVAVTARRPGVRLRAVFRSASRHCAVQGERTWDEAIADGRSLRLSCRDRIVLGPWLERSGPYAGDFLIPEPWRRIVYANRVRSGAATAEDARPEWRNSSTPIYDARVFAEITGTGCRLASDGADWQWLSPALDPDQTVEYEIRFSDQRFHADADTGTVRRVGGSERSAPVLELPRYTAVERFFRGVPGIVDACTVRGIGMPRASHGAYYWIWAWDALVAAAEYPRWGALAAMRNVVRFVNAHRDTDGRIPARWTRDLLPLDTPDHGALEFLLLNTTLEYTAQSGDVQPLLNAYPYAVSHSQALEAASDPRGVFPSLGFYPDLPERLGRTRRSALAMEVAAHAAFCDALAEAAQLLGDAAQETRARGQMKRIADSFASVFLADQAIGRELPVDAVDMDSGIHNGAHPIYTLLFLQRPAAVSLLGDKVPAIASALARDYLGDFGLSLVPASDAHRYTEDAMHSWYAHWDLYAVRLWRATGNTGALLRWLDLVERALTRLGYCPEFLSTPPFERGDADAWKAHGAASNINGVTAWYRAIIEGLAGLRLDDGRMRILPLALPIPRIGITGLMHRNTRWDVTVQTPGAGEPRVFLDGSALDGLEVPEAAFDGTRHALDIVYSGSV